MIKTHPIPRTFLFVLQPRLGPLCVPIYTSLLPPCRSPYNMLRRDWNSSLYGRSSCYSFPSNIDILVAIQRSQQLVQVLLSEPIIQVVIFLPRLPPARHLKTRSPPGVSVFIRSNKCKLVGSISTSSSKSQTIILYDPASSSYFLQSSSEYPIRCRCHISTLFPDVLL